MMNKRRFTMYTKQPKKMIIINILDILKRYTDENHRLSQREIMDILEREYDMKVDRKAVMKSLSPFSFLPMCLTPSQPTTFVL